jgi:ATP-dependent helicase HrpB
MLQSDPALEGVAAVLFDEFHERSLQADLGLALCLDARAQLGTELRVLVMSATLDGERVAALLGDAPVVSSPGRSFEVTVRYLGQGLPLLPGGFDSPERATAAAVQRALRDEPEGDVLVFLPGAPEIRRVGGMLEGAGEVVVQRARVLPLYGELGPDQQDAALDPTPGGLRRVILATNIAETSLTLPGVRVVVDSGLVRRSMFDPVTGMSRLETQRISRASAEQRAGRAGRVAEGVCYRLWSEGSQRSLAPFTPAEILSADLVPLALELAGWGAEDAASLAWLDPPPAAVMASARELLARLGALDAGGRLTPHGRQLAAVPTHPRLAQLLVESRRRGTPRLGAELAALLSDRDILRGGGSRGGAAASRDADLLSRLELLRGGGGVAAVDRAGLERARRAVAIFERASAGEGGGAGVRRSGAASSAALGPGGLVACAWPDRVGRLRSGAPGRFLLSNGRGAAFAHPDRLAACEFIVAIDLDDRDREARVLLAAELDRDELREALAAQLAVTDEVAWSSREQAVVARRVERLDALVVREQPLHPPPAEAALAAMIEGVRELGVARLPWDESLRSWQARVQLARRAGLPGTADWPDFGDEALAGSAAEWLAPWLEGVTRASQLARVPLGDALRARLGYERARRLDEWLPTHIELPTGTHARVDYLDDLAPSCAMRMQEVFGLAATPALAGGALPVTFKLLSPAQRPLQVTRDLASFWRNAYAEVRKDMRGRYPRHYWPENPLEAEPTRGTRRR